MKLTLDIAVTTLMVIGLLYATVALYFKVTGAAELLAIMGLLILLHGINRRWIR